MYIIITRPSDHAFIVIIVEYNEILFIIIIISYAILRLERTLENGYIHTCTARV